MSGKGLRAIKGTAQMEELKVTPELKAKLRERIELAAIEVPIKEFKVYRPWLRPAGYSALVAALLTLALLNAPRPTTAPNGAAAPTHAYTPSGAQSQQPASGSGQVTGSIALTSNLVTLDRGRSYTITATDSNGNAVAYDADLAAPQGGAEVQPGRKIIVNGEFTIRVTDARAAMASLQQQAITAGGYVAEANVNKEADGSWLGRVILRVPSDRAAATIGALGQVGEIERERQWTQDVTDQYMDLGHRIEVLKEHEERLRQLADKAATFDDWNKLAQNINATRVEIENLTGKLKLLSNQVDFAILNVQVFQPAPGVVPVAKGATTIPGQMGEAFANTLRAIGAVLVRMTVGLAAMGPYLLMLIPATAGLFLWQRRRRKEA